jgi:hypothetical protein
VFYGWRAFNNLNEVTADVVVVRDDNGGAGQQPFRALVDSSGVVGFLCLRVQGSGASARWVTEFQHSGDGLNWTSLLLATAPANTPAPQFQPYIGDYNHMVAVDGAFYGIFSANNRPNRADFPNGVKYQRDHDFATRRLLDLNGNLVADSIDPFFFKAS